MPPPSASPALALGLTLCAGALALSRPPQPAPPPPRLPGAVPPLGWSTWCTGASCAQNKRVSGNAHDVCTESEIKAVASAMQANGLQRAGYRYIMLDDCWGATQRSASGHLAADTTRFPSGNGTLAELASWLHARSFLLGAYLTAGNETCSTGGRRIPGEPNARGVPGSCDGVTPEVCLPQYQRDTNTLAAWGAVKLDWCKFNGAPGNQQPLTDAFGTALSRTGRPIFFAFHCGAAWADWCPLAGETRAWRIYKDHHDVWDDGSGGSTSAIIDVLGTVANHSRPYAWGDPDVLMTGGAGCDARLPGVRCPGMSPTEYRTEFAMWVMAAAPLLVSTDVRKLSPLMSEVLLHEELLAISQDPLGRADGAVRAMPCAGSAKPTACQVWTKPLTGGGKAVALYNSANATANLSLPLAGLFPRSAPRSIDVRDVWARRDLGRFAAAAGFAAAVEPHGTRVLVVRPAA